MTTATTEEDCTHPTNIFNNPSPLIRSKDLVILYHARDNISAITVLPGQSTATKYGLFDHSEMIGIPFGSKFSSRNNRGFTHLLRPTPELWTQALPHRTQILYLPDIAFITSHLDIKPGSIVIEAGTGSGSFSHSIARTIGPLGNLYTFEFHVERFEKAKVEFQKHGLLKRGLGPITLEHRNVIKNGFGNHLQHLADSVFLDLPAPWDALQSAKKVMNRKVLSRICCFSPCIEQVTRTVDSLKTLGFTSIETFETLTRTHEPITIDLPSVESAVTRIGQVEKKKMKRRDRQIEEAKRRKDRNLVVEQNGEPVTSTTASTLMPIVEKEMVSQPSVESDSFNQLKTLDSKKDANEVNVEPGPASKRARLEPESIAKVPNSEAIEVIPSTNDSALDLHLITSRPVASSRGHTSFLTFAELLPEMTAIAPESNNEASEQNSTIDASLDEDAKDSMIGTSVGVTAHSFQEAMEE